MELDIPRDRNGEFEPVVVPKHTRDISGIEEQVISLYSRGMSTRDIHEQVKDLYGIEVSADMVSKITDKIIPLINEWKNRPLEPIYPFIFLDAIQTAYPSSEIQRCIVHQLRNSFKYVNYKDLREFANDFKEVYKAVNEEMGYQKLLELEEKWGKKYPYAIKSWDMNWDSIINQLLIFFEGRVEQ